MADRTKAISFLKSMFEKPGDATHSAKWDRCVEHVKANGNGTNAYAVCTSMLGEESLKAMNDDEFMMEVSNFMEKLGISGAGPVPNSLLARQDLEGDVTKSRKSMATKNKGATEKATGDSMYNQMISNARIMARNGMGAEDVAKKLWAAAGGKTNFAEVRSVIYEVFGKGQVEETGKELVEAKKDAKEVETKSERNELVENIKNIQERRQKATIQARSKEQTKSFKEVFTAMNKK